MSTDWELIRNLMNAALDACQTVDRLNIDLNDHAKTTEVNGQNVSVSDFLQSAHTYPEALRYSIIRSRHDLGDDTPYTPETARILVNVAKACAELIDARELNIATTGVHPQLTAKTQSIRQEVDGLARWYGEHFSPRLTEILKTDDES